MKKFYAMTKDKIKKAIENGSSFSVHGRPLRIFQDRLVIEINMGRGSKAYANLSNEDLANLKEHQSMNTHGGKRKGAGRPKGSGKGRTVKTSSINLPPSVWEKLDELRGEQSRSRWITNLIKEYE